MTVSSLFPILVFQFHSFASLQWSVVVAAMVVVVVVVVVAVAVVAVVQM